MLQLIEKLNTELSAIKERAALSPITMRQLMECAYDMAQKQIVLSEEKRRREVSV